MVHQGDCNTIFCPPGQILVITHIKHIPLIKIKSFLHQKYVTEGLGINEIASLTLSSRSTVIKYLRKAEIPIRAEDQKIGSLGYGMRKFKGRFIPHKQELEMIQRMKDLKSQGQTFRQIANTFQELGLQSKRGGKWTGRAIQRILLRNGLNGTI